MAVLLGKGSFRGEKSSDGAQLHQRGEDPCRREAGTPSATSTSLVTPRACRRCGRSLWGHTPPSLRDLHHQPWMFSPEISVSAALFQAPRGCTSCIPAPASSPCAADHPASPLFPQDGGREAQTSSARLGELKQESRCLETTKLSHFPTPSPGWKLRRARAGRALQPESP